jgi:hypothetical protein
MSTSESERVAIEVPGNPAVTLVGTLEHVIAKAGAKTNDCNETHPTSNYNTNTKPIALVKVIIQNTQQHLLGVQILHGTLG